MKNASQPSPPYLGAAYYPEAWPDGLVDEDIALMKQAGLNVVRIGEFAWSRIEPREGEYEFAWLHRVIDKLGEAGIATILGTPTCTPPIWLTEKYPEILAMDDHGRRTHHGARRHACPTSPVYRELAARIVTRMAEEFGKDDRILGWQIDNELYPHGPRGCFCPVCVQAFHKRLEAKYGTIEALNDAWGTALWSQTYQRFDQVPPPHAHVWHHPSLYLDWMLIQVEAYAQFSDAQAAILHRHTRQPVGTDVMPRLGLSHRRLNENLDVVQFNHYHDDRALWQAVFWMDWCRTIKPRPFWVTETATCWAGNVVTAGYKRPGFCRVNSWLPLALGGEANLYWLLRAHRSGQELMCGSVVSSCGRPMHVFDEVQQLSREFERAAEFLTTTRPVISGLAIHQSTFAWWFFQTQPLVAGFEYGGQLRNTVYHPLFEALLRPDIVDPESLLDPYRVVISAFLPALDEADLRRRLRTWIENGGTWIAGPFTDIRTLNGTKFTHAPFGSLEEWGGVRCEWEVPANLPFGLRWGDRTESKGSVWYAGFEPTGAEVLATYADCEFEGLAAVTVHPMGRGRVVVLGTMPEPEAFRRLVIRLCDDAGIRPTANASPGVLAVPRRGQDFEGMIVIETENRKATLQLEHGGVDLLTGTRYAPGKLDLAPWDVLVLRYEM